MFQIGLMHMQKKMFSLLTSLWPSPPSLSSSFSSIDLLLGARCSDSLNRPERLWAPTALPATAFSIPCLSLSCLSSRSLSFCSCLLFSVLEEERQGKSQVRAMPLSARRRETNNPINLLECLNFDALEGLDEEDGLEKDRSMQRKQLSILSEILLIRNL